MSEETFEVIEDTRETVLRVRASSSPQALAAAIAHALYQDREVTLRAIGAGAVNQAIKGCAIARGFVAPKGYDLTIKPAFQTVKMAEGDISAIVLRVLVDK